MDIPGLGRPLGNPDLGVAGSMYNSLAHVKALLALIAKYGTGAFFGIHLVHRHDLLSKGTVRLENEDIGMKGGLWTKAAAIDSADVKNMHGTLFKLDQKAFVPFEFAAGLSPVATGAGVTKNAPAAFLAEVAAYLTKYNLSDSLALEVKDFALHNAQGLERTAEIEVQWGEEADADSFTVVLPLSARNRGTRTVADLTPTGWCISREPCGGASGSPSDPDPVQPGTHYEKVVVGPKKDTHKVVITNIASSGSALAPVTVSLLLQELADMGFIAAEA
ncbi:hypothetical protein MKZ38_009168 [Zalerion maritima]|uniref:Uncharacterized protein n=1 Tax=Zalerion maritima TaxID=339359 RepID=A0AAD5RK98_9PEZI|nr:hypothetical protein MKZ38_009168 [Zalerion maritima]